jgi:hypothetical protein
VQLACTVFGTNNALVALLDSERIIIRNGSGMFAPGDFPWRYSFCGYTLSPPNPTAMVIEDSFKDARCEDPSSSASLPVWPGGRHWPPAPSALPCYYQPGAPSRGVVFGLAVQVTLAQDQALCMCLLLFSSGNC